MEPILNALRNKIEKKYPLNYVYNRISSIKIGYFPPSHASDGSHTHFEWKLSIFNRVAFVILENEREKKFVRCTKRHRGIPIICPPVTSFLIQIAWLRTDNGPWIILSYSLLLTVYSYIFPVFSFQLNSHMPMQKKKYGLNWMPHME